MISRHLTCLAVIIAGLAATGCGSDKEDVFTVVAGRVINKHTGHPVATAPVAVSRITYRLFGTPTYDSVTTAYTDADGQYSLSFNASHKGNYAVKLQESQEFYDLSDFPGSDGTEAKLGTKNEINFEVTPYKMMTVNAASGKGGKSDISFSFESADQQNWFGGAIFNDTVRANQNVSFTRAIKVLPNREYIFTKVTCNRVRLSGFNYEFRDYTYQKYTRKVLYNDTTIVRFN